MNAPSSNARVEPVSWRGAWRQGIGVLLNHRLLLLLVALAVLSERLVTVLVTLDPQLRASCIEAVQRLTVASARAGRFQTSEFMATFPWPLIVAPVAVLFGMLLLIGILTLVRDLLLQGRYESRLVMRRGGHFFWPVLRYKLPVYCAGSLLSLPVAQTLWHAWIAGTTDAVWPVAGLMALWLSVFSIARVFLSLGTKVIVTESPMPTHRVYRRVWQIIRPQLGSVIVFYLLLIALTLLTLAAVWGMSLLPVPAPLRVAAAILAMAIVTLTMESAAFDLYLQLTGHRVPGVPVHG